MVTKRKINLSVINNLQTKLDAQEEWKTEFTLMETVGLLFSSIDTAIKRKVSWASIVELFQESMGDGEKISSVTLRQYYLRFKKHPEKLPKRKLNSSHSKKKKNDVSEVSIPLTTTEGSNHSNGCSTPASQETFQPVKGKAENTAETIALSELPVPKTRRKNGSSSLTKLKA